MTSAQPLTSSRLTLLQTSPLAHTTTSMNMDSDSSVDSSSSSSSTGDDSPTTPTSAMMTLAGNPTFRSKSKHSQSSSPSSNIPSSSSKGDSSEDEAQTSSDSSDSSTSNKPKPQQPEDSSSYPEPVFSSIPKRRVQSSNAVLRGTTISPISYTCATAPSSPSPTSTTFPRRIPSFPVSRPIRPFDSISNAMGTAPKRVSPPLSPLEPLAPHPHPHPSVYGVGDEKLHMNMKSKGLSVQTIGLETGKPKGRSNVLLAPPKNNRFQHGFFILDMTQDEFKTRAW